MMRSKYIFLLLFFSCTLLGQFEEVIEDEELDDISRVHFFETNFSMYSPLGAFSSKIERDLLYGFSLGYLTQLQVEKPSFLGIEIFHMNLGRYTKNYDAFVGNEQLVLTGKVASNALGFNLVYRYYAPFKYKVIEPYFEGQFGMKYLYSYLSEAGSFIDGEPYDNFDLFEGDWVLTYGAALGMQIHISDIYYLNLKATYHLAVSGEYQKKVEGNLAFIDFPQDAFESVQSSTDVIKMDIGFTILF
jgi:hypothetical protein